MTWTINYEHKWQKFFHYENVEMIFKVLKTVINSTHLVIHGENELKKTCMQFQVGWFMVFIASQLNCWRKPEYPEKTTDLSLTNFIT